MSAACVTASFQIRSMACSVPMALPTRRSSGTLCIIVKGPSIANQALKLLPFHICAKHTILHNSHPAEDVPISSLWCS